MGGEVADISFTSPPYNAGFGKCITKDNGRSKYINDEDNRSQEEFAEFLNEYLHCSFIASQYTFCNIQMLANNKKALIQVMHDNIDLLADMIIWDKGRSQPQLDANVLNSEWEFVLVFSQSGKRAIGTNYFHGTLKNIVRISNVVHNEFAGKHNATFPMEFADHFVRNFSTNSCVDLFGGTGTTLMVCEQLKRKCYMMELEPTYCDIIIDRWEQYTGKKAVQIDG